MNDQISQLGQWLIHGEQLLALLKRAASGEDPDAIYAELYANAQHHDKDDD